MMSTQDHHIVAIPDPQHQHSINCSCCLSCCISPLVALCPLSYQLSVSFVAWGGWYIGRLLLVLLNSFSILISYQLLLSAVLNFGLEIFYQHHTILVVLSHVVLHLTIEQGTMGAEQSFPFLMREWVLVTRPHCHWELIMQTEHFHSHCY